MEYGTVYRVIIVAMMLVYRHTGVVVFGREYFFGGMGIQWCNPVSINVINVKCSNL